MPGQRFREMWRQLKLLRERGGDPRGDLLIVFYNSMFGAPLGLARFSGPEGVRFSGNRLRWRHADAVVFHIQYPLIDHMPTDKPHGQLWVAWAMESESNFPQLADPAYMSRFDLQMTYRQSADVWVPYELEPDSEVIQRLRNPMAAPKSSDRLVASFISSSVDQSARIRYVTELGRQIEVHAYGKVGRNRFLAEDLGPTTKLEVVAGYKFTIAFENSIAEDYVTEKFYEPLYAGSVPVYLGAPNVAEFAPGAHSFIDVRDFASLKDLAAYLLYLDLDDESYQAYHAWRQQPFLPAFEAKWERRQKDGAAFEALGRVVRSRTTGGQWQTRSIKT